jgi:hypothetical protein
MLDLPESAMISILVVEDDEDTRAEAVVALDDADYPVRGVGSGEALEAFGRLKPDIVVLAHIPEEAREEIAEAIQAADPPCTVVSVLAAEPETFVYREGWRYIWRDYSVDKLIDAVNSEVLIINEQSGFYEEPELDPSAPIVLLIGDLRHEGIISTLGAAKRQYKQKVLLSSVGNWESIIEYFEQFTVAATLVKLTARVYDLLDHEQYADVRERLFGCITRGPHAVFVYESLLAPETQKRWADGFYRPAAQVRADVNEWLDATGVTVIPYTKNAEITVIGQTLITETEEGLLFRLYIPSGRIWAAESDRFLQLFKDYLAKVGHQSVRLDQVRTANGIIYEFHADDLRQEGQLSTEFQSFTHLLDLIVSNPAAAEELLRSKDVDAREISEILVRYAKEARRLHVDLRHERERKALTIRQRLESELADALPPSVGWDAINQLIESTVPQITGVATALTVDQRPALGPAMSAKNVTINVGSNVINAVNAVVADEISGEVHLNEYDQQLLTLIREHGGERAPELASAVHELSDTSAPQAGRLLAKQRLKGFLFAVASKATDVATGMLQSYLEGRLGF